MFQVAHCFITDNIYYCCYTVSQFRKSESQFRKSDSQFSESASQSVSLQEIFINSVLFINSGSLQDLVISKSAGTI